MPVELSPTALRDLEPGVTSLDDSRAWCRAMCSHYENFALSSILFPQRLRPALEGIYAFARFSDDLADECPEVLAELDSAELRTLRLKHWRDLVATLPESRDAHPILRVLAADMTVHHFPHEELLRLLDAFLRDQEDRPFANDNELLAYCRGSAAPVGRLLLALNGIHKESAGFEELAALSDRVCTGLQLANFWQDFSRDLPVGRLYVPLDRLERHKLTSKPAELALTGSAFRPLLRELLEWAESELNAGMELAQGLSFRFGLDVRLFMGGGLAVCKQVRRQGEAVLWRRQELNSREKRALAVRAFIDAIRRPRA